MKGLFIVFEGIDCSGKSTQIELLYKYLCLNKYLVTWSNEPTDSTIGFFLRKCLKDTSLLKQSQSDYNRQLAYLFAADRHYHLHNQMDGVIKYINDGFIVLSSRYYFSSIAYNSNSSDEFDFITRINQDFIKPDLLIYLDIPVDIALERLSQRKHLDTYEHFQKLKQVESNYHKIIANYTGQKLVVNATDNLLSIHKTIIDSLDKLTHV